MFIVGLIVGAVVGMFLMFFHAKGLLNHLHEKVDELEARNEQLYDLSTLFHQSVPFNGSSMMDDATQLALEQVMHTLSSN